MRWKFYECTAWKKKKRGESFVNRGYSLRNLYVEKFSLEKDVYQYLIWSCRDLSREIVSYELFDWNEETKNRFISCERKEGPLLPPVSAIVAKSRPSLTMMERLIAPCSPLPQLRVLIVIVRWRREDKELEGALKNWRASGAQRALNKRCLPRTEKPLLSFRPITVRITASKRSWKITTIRDRSSNNTGRSVTPPEDNFKRGRIFRIFQRKKMACIFMYRDCIKFYLFKFW